MKTKKSILFSVLACVATYLAFSFVELTIDFRLWESFQRVALVFLCAFFSAMVCVFTNSND